MALFKLKFKNPLKNPKLQEKAGRYVWLLKAGKIAGTAVPIIVGAFAGLNTFITGIFEVETTPRQAADIIQEAPNTEIKSLLIELGEETNSLRAFVFVYFRGDDNTVSAQFTRKLQWARNGLQLIPEGKYPINDNTFSRHRYDSLGRLDCSTLRTSQLPTTEPLRKALEASGSTHQIACPIPLAENGLAAIAVEFSNEVSDPIRVQSLLLEYGSRVGLLIDSPRERQDADL